MERVWKRPTAVKGHLNRIQQQLNGSRQELLTWSKDLVKTRGAAIKVKSEMLKNLKERVGPEQTEEIKRLSVELSSLLEQDYLWWKQRTKRHWLQNGDRNIKFFHACAN